MRLRPHSDNRLHGVQLNADHETAAISYILDEWSGIRRL